MSALILSYACVVNQRTCYGQSNGIQILCISSNLCGVGEHVSFLTCYLKIY